MAINIPQYAALSQMSIKAFTKHPYPLSAFSADFSDATKSLYESVLVPVIGAPASASEFSHEKGYSGTNSTLKTVPVQLSHRLAVVDDLQDTLMETLSPDALAKMSEAALERLRADSAALTVAGMVSAEGVGKFECAASNYSFAKVLELGTQATLAGLSSFGRVQVLSAPTHDALANDPKISGSFVTAVAAKALQEGVVPNVGGMDTHKVASVAEGVNGFMALPYSVAIASRATPPTGGELFYTTLKDPRTGFTVTRKVIADATHSLTKIVTECLFGFAVAAPESIIKITQPAG